MSFVARMERSGMRGEANIPDFASLHPGYACFHIDGLKQDGQPVPQPTSIADYVDA